MMIFIKKTFEKHNWKSRKFLLLQYSIGQRLQSALAVMKVNRDLLMLYCFCERTCEKPKPKNLVALSLSRIRLPKYSEISTEKVHLYKTCLFMRLIYSNLTP